MISVVLATHNEERNLTACLKSVQPWAGEVVVVDGSSTDDTPELAERLGARVIKTTNKANFHINKQQAMNQAKGQLVLQLDADEVVDDQLAEFIQKIARQLDQTTPKAWIIDQPAAWWVRRKNFFMGKFLGKGGQYPDPVIRLYINGYARLPQKDVHEQMAVTGTTAWAEGHLLHYSNPSFKDYLLKFNRYTSFKARQLRAEHLKINLINSWRYLIWKPKLTFLQLFFRHKGFVDGVPGFVFALMSGLHHPVAYLKLWELYHRQQGKHD